MVDTARQAVNHSIGTLGPNGEDMSKHRAAQFCRDLNGSPVIMDLFNNAPVVSLAEREMGVRPCERGYIVIVLKFYFS